MQFRRDDAQGAEAFAALEGFVGLKPPWIATAVAVSWPGVTEARRGHGKSWKLDETCELQIVAVHLCPFVFPYQFDCSTTRRAFGLFHLFFEPHRKRSRCTSGVASFWPRAVPVTRRRCVTTWMSSLFPWPGRLVRAGPIL